MISILPILILLISILSIGFIISKVLGSKIWTVKVNGLVVMAYIVLGFIAMIVLHFTSKENEMISKAAMEEKYQEQLQMGFALENGNLDYLNEDYLVKKSTIELASNQFTIRTFTDVYGLRVVVKKRDDPSSNVIHARTYVTPHIVNRFDLREYVSIDFIKSSNDELIITNVPEREFHYYQISPRMEMLAQFKGNNFEIEDDYNLVSGSIILFLNVPSHVTIIDESGYIDLVK